MIGGLLALGDLYDYVGETLAVGIVEGVEFAVGAAVDDWLVAYHSDGYARRSLSDWATGIEGFIYHPVLYICVAWYYDANAAARWN